MAAPGHLRFCGVALEQSATLWPGLPKYEGRFDRFRIRVWPTSLGWRARVDIGSCAISTSARAESAQAALRSLRIELRRTVTALQALLARKARRV